jgi:hypothetical protein
MENLNLKYELPNYYFHKRKDLMGKNHNSKYIKKFDHRNPPKNSSIISMLPQHIIIEYFNYYKHYLKVHEVHIHWLWTITYFWVFFKKSIMLWQFKKYSKYSCNVLYYIYNYSVECFINLITWPITNFKIL